MGGAVSSENNDQLINLLIEFGYIKSNEVERVFREVDRGDYVQQSNRDVAYEDLSWKSGNIHLSAPCVYCKVMEGLSLKPGLSFLNIGSGTGYLSTMAGLILGENGTNHGIEMHEDCLNYAYEHLEAYKEKSLNVDRFEFCEPVFQLGNVLNVIQNRRYDRVYCGAGCPEIHEKFVKQFVKVGGILVMPYKDHLLRIERMDENTWRNHTMLPVSFAMLASPQEGSERTLIHLPLSQPTSLQELCRGLIRRHLRKIVWAENDLEYKTAIEPQPVAEHAPPQLHIAIPISPQAQQRQVNSAVQQLFNGLVQLPQRRHRLDIELYIPVHNDRPDSQETSHTPMEEDDPVDDVAPISKQENSVPVEDDDSDDSDDNQDDNGSLFDRTLESKLKRRKSAGPSTNNESNDTKLCRLSGDNDVSEVAQNGRISGLDSPAASNSDSDDDDDDDVALLKTAFSLFKDRFNKAESERNAESDSSDSSCEAMEESSARNFETRCSEAVRNSASVSVASMVAGSPSSLAMDSPPINQSRMSSNRRQNCSDDEEEAKSSDHCCIYHNVDNSSNESSSDTSSEDDDEFGIFNRTGLQRNSSQKRRRSKLASEQNRKQYFAHKIQKETQSALMKAKVSRLPLPLPLRLYVNYNREL